MTGFARRPLAVFVCCLFAGMQASHAADEIQDSAVNPSSPGEAGNKSVLAERGPQPKLRLERKFNVLGRKKTQLVKGVGLENPVDLKKGDSYPTFIIADRFSGRVGESTLATGSVEVRKLDSLIYSEKLTHWPLEDEVEAIGNVRMLQEGTEVVAPYLRMRLSEQFGFANDAKYHFANQVQNRVYEAQQIVVTAATSNATSAGAPLMLNVPNSYGLPTVAPPLRPSEASGQAERVDFEGENQIRLSSATYSTCKPGQNDWYLRASELHLDYDRDVANASNAVVWFKSVPIFYSPVASFSLNREPHSGLLPPHFSLSSKLGFDMVMPYYWAIAPNYDATLYPRYMSKRGFQLGAEARYADYYTRNTTHIEYMPNDEILKRERYAFDIQHQQNLGRGFSAAVNMKGVSDSQYWTDLSSRLFLTSETQLARQLLLSYVPTPELQTSVQVMHFQTLQPDPANPVTRPYFLDPQMNIVGFKPNVLGTDLSMVGQLTRFTHPTKVDGERFVLYPQVSLPIVDPAFQITPKLGLHMTKYQLQQQTVGDPTSINRVVPTFSFDSTVVFERESVWLDKSYIQTLEPRLYYVNIPYRDQSKIPLFDSGLSDFNFAQIFSENRYSGFDRINDANQLTAAITTRFLGADTGAELFKAMLGQRYYFKQQQVTIPGETARTDTSSHLLAAATGLVGQKTYADAAWEYDYRSSINNAFSLGMRYQPEIAKVLSGSYRLTRDQLTGKSTVEEFDIAGQWPLGSRWYAIGRYNYSLRDKQLLEAIGGFEYNAGCWAARAVIQRLAATAGTPTNTFFLQLELNDFASIGSNPLGLLRRTIPGYGKSNELPTSGSLLSTQ